MKARRGHPPKPPTSHGVAARHTLSRIGNVYLCACGFAVMGAATKADADARFQFHLRAVKDYLDEELAQRQADAATFTDGKSLQDQ